MIWLLCYQKWYSDFIGAFGIFDLWWNFRINWVFQQRGGFQGICECYWYIIVGRVITSVEESADFWSHWNMDGEAVMWRVLIGRIVKSLFLQYNDEISVMWLILAFAKRILHIIRECPSGKEGFQTFVLSPESLHADKPACGYKLKWNKVRRCDRSIKEKQYIDALKEL